MNIKHHPDNATIMAYAAGTLDEAFGVLVSCHLETCSACRQTLQNAELIGGASFECVEEVPVSEGSFGRLLEKISLEDEKAKNPGQDVVDDTGKTQMDWETMPRALQHYLEGSLSEIKWKRVAPGAWQKQVELSKGAKSSLRLLKIAPGRKMPEHGHGGQEATLILSGAYVDSIGHFGPGDVADLDDHTEHEPHVVSSEACICLVATEAPTQFKGLVSRLLQPVIGI